ncbi:MAG: AzlD domain-containing protein [Eubacteriales bacterium]
MSIGKVLLVISVMALCTYLPRMLPLALFRRKIKNQFLSSLLCYLPYGILAAMVFPDIFNSTASVVSGITGTAAALLLAYRKKGLLPVAVCACVTVFLTERILGLTGIL